MIKMMNNIVKTTHKAMKGAKFVELRVRVRLVTVKKDIIRHNKVYCKGKACYNYIKKSTVSSCNHFKRNNIRSYSRKEITNNIQDQVMYFSMLQRNLLKTLGRH